MRSMIVHIFIVLMVFTCVQRAFAQGGNTGETWGMTHTASVDRSHVELVSRFNLGFTWTHISLDQPKAHPQAVQQATDLLIEAKPAFQNTHIIGWGVGNIQPEPGKYNWSSLDTRIARMRDMNIPIVITLCTAPGWMKKGADTWKMNTAPLDEHFEAFADLCLEVAKRYPDVRYYQVWNEFKGFWDSDHDTWSAQRYTRMYNMIYDRLKSHNPDLKVGGLYLVVEGTGSKHLGYQGWQTSNPITERNRKVIEYWLMHKHGADFICVDKGLKDFHDKNPYSAHELITFAQQFSNIARQIRQLTDLPIWWSEYYAASGTEAQRGAAFASIYHHMIRSGSDVALLWNPIEGEVPCQMITDVRSDDGGQPEPHYYVFKAIQEHFQQGSAIYRTTTSTPRIEVLASDTATMVINKYDVSARVKLDGQTLRLKPYEVRLIPNESVKEQP